MATQYKIRRKTAEETISLLSSVKVTLRSGRPRKRPNLGRPLAVNAYGKPVKPTSDEAVKRSLVGALKADAKLHGFSPTIEKVAAEYFLKAFGFPYWHKGDISIIDQEYWDTREFQRTCDRAIKLIAAEAGL